MFLQQTALHVLNFVQTDVVTTIERSTSEEKKIMLNQSLLTFALCSGTFGIL